jgi:adenylate cyclase
VHDVRALISEPRQIDIEEVRELSKLVLRLEALTTNASASAVIASMPPGSPPPMSPVPGMEMTPSRRSHTHRGVRLPPPTYLGPSIKDEMNDDELTLIIESLTTRLENTMSTLVSKSWHEGETQD